jgi:replicative DNA helicase
MAGWADNVLHGKPPPRWPAGAGPLERFPLGPGLVTLVGGPPGCGKTALANQLAIDAVRLSPDLRALVTCCEIPPGVLLDRTLSRLSGVPYRLIRDRELREEDQAAVQTGMATLASLGDRVGFHTGPFTLDAVADSADGAGADLILIDYLQRLTATGPHRDRRGMTNAILDTFRAFAGAGRGLLVLSSVGRQPTGKHGKSSYTDLGLASFKESGDIEYSADDAFVLPPADKDGIALLRHVKARHTEPTDILLRADLAFMRFDPETADPVDGAPAAVLDRARRLWANGPPKGDGR